MDAKRFDKSRLPVSNPLREMLSTSATVHGRGMGETRDSPLTAFCGQVGSEAVVRRPIILVRDGDIISTDAEEGALGLRADTSELESRRKAWKSPADSYQIGVLRKYADQVGPARQGAVTQAGGEAEVVCYAEI